MSLLEDPGKDGMIILKSVFQKPDDKVHLDKVQNMDQWQALVTND
jgi:hypothetical protein